jgi:hypothetical protein
MMPDGRFFILYIRAIQCCPDVIYCTLCTCQSALPPVYCTYSTYSVKCVALLTLTIAHFIYFVHSEIQISDIHPAMHSLHWLSYLGPDCELGHYLLASTSYHLILNSECSISAKNFVGKQAPVYQQSCANEVKDTFHSVQEAKQDITYQSIPFLSSTLTC